MVRDENQDVFLGREDLGLVLLADGVARPRAGRIAAEVAVETASEYLEGVTRQGPVDGQQLLKALEIANERVFGLSFAVSAYRGMATTLVAAVVDGSRGYVAHVGDSRAYRFRDGVLTGITKDHNVAQQWVDAGVMSPGQARRSHRRHVVTRAIGAEPALRPEVKQLDVAPHDLLLLCSDGLTEHLEDGEIESHLAAPASLGEAADHLVEAALDAGGTDNVTVVLVRC